MSVRPPGRSRRPNFRTRVPDRRNAALRPPATCTFRTSGCTSPRLVYTVQYANCTSLLCPSGHYFRSLPDTTSASGHYFHILHYFILIRISMRSHTLCPRATVQCTVLTNLLFSPVQLLSRCLRVLLHHSTPSDQLTRLTAAGVSLSGVSATVYCTFVLLRPARSEAAF